MPNTTAQPPSDNSELYLMVGEIRSDVKKLLENKADTDKRITGIEQETDRRMGAIEHKIWSAAGAVGVIMMFASGVVFKMLGH